MSDTAASKAFYAALGLTEGSATLNKGGAQQKLDDLRNVVVDVIPMLPPSNTPHIELLGYQSPRGQAGEPLLANDVAATRIVCRGSTPTLLADLDGHLLQVVV